MRIKTMVAALMLVASTIAAAQQATKAAIYVEYTTEDNQGHRLAYAVKEQIRTSAGMRLVDSAGDSGLQVHLGSIDSSGTQTQTAYSVAYTVRDFSHPDGFPYYLDSTGGICGAQVIDQCANAIVARLDNNLSLIRAAFSSQKK
jgi:hypothetical protein